MRKPMRALVALAVTTTFVVTACSDASRPFASAPVRDVAQESQNLLGGLLGTVTSLLVAPLHRTTPLPADVVWTFTAGPEGAVSSNPSVGLKITVPAGALTSTQTITVTALAGSLVAYRFEPHLEFERKVSLRQNLDGTDVGLLSGAVLKGAHFPGDAPVLTDDGLAIVDEIVAATVNLLTRTVKFDVGHFSGWIVASGMGGDAY
ncbi:MAG: hypothetical protein WD825_16880 [Gemmatimonadaceae bacterium]